MVSFNFCTCFKLYDRFSNAFDNVKFECELQAPANETVKTLEEKANRIQEYRSQMEKSFLKLAELCSRIHMMAPNADEECLKILDNLCLKSGGSLENDNANFDKRVAQLREETVEYFTLKAELEIVNHEIGRLIGDFRTILMTIDSSESATLNQAISDMQL